MTTSPTWRQPPRGHARVEDRIRCAKDTGLRNLPFYEFANNAGWTEMVAIAQDLLAWTQGLCLKGKLARAEPRGLRFMVLHMAGRLVRGGGSTNLRLEADWPWAQELVRAFAMLMASASPPDPFFLTHQQTPGLSGRFNALKPAFRRQQPCRHAISPPGTHETRA
jgi:hypothetical protein